MLNAVLLWMLVFQVATNPEQSELPRDAATPPIGSQDLKTEESPDIELAEAVNEQIKRLRDGTEQSRDSAERVLVSLGPAILDLLPTVTVDTPEELRARLNRVRRQLLQAAAKKAVRGSRVTISGTMKLSDALANLQSQTNNQLVDFRDRMGQPRLDPSLELDLQDVAYWTAIESIFEQAGLQLYAYTNQPNTLGYIVREGELTEAARAAATDLFRMQVIRLQAIRDLRDRDNEGLVVTLEVTWEPRLTPVIIRQPPSDITAIADNGQSLPFIENRGITEMSVQEGIASVELELPFKLPRRQSQSIRSLQGTITAAIPGGNMQLEFDDLEQAREVVKGEGGISVVLLRVRKSGELYDFRIMLRLDKSSGDLRTQRGWVYANQAYLLDAKGNRVDYAGFESFRDTADEIGLSYKFDASQGLAQYRFVYHSPSTMLTVPVNYKIENIRLP